MPDAKEGLRPPNDFWDFYQDPANAGMTDREMGLVFRRDRTTITKWRKYIRNHPRDTHWAPLTRKFPDELHDLKPKHIPAMLADFISFRGRHFSTPRGEQYLTEKFHLHWIKSFLHAMVTGGRLVILSPPRHGKTELLIHFCTWLVIRFPLIRILWVGGNEGIAKRSLGQVQTHLLNNATLIAENLPPELKSFQPDRGGEPWNRNEFTVATRPFPIKGTSMTALGRGGTLLSLDADLIIADDIEDHKSTVQPLSRENTREWWTSQLESRKEEHTALVLIGSRQHPDDLAGHLLENNEYVSIVETAHDPLCARPDDPQNYPRHRTCMLFPKVRSYRWLMGQRRAAETTGGRAHFEMVYLNISHPKGLVVFTPDIVNRGIDRSRSLGHTPANSRLIAGLDPSGVGFQGAFLWAVTTEPFKMYMVDMDNNEGGGAREARRIITQWKSQYGCSHWVVEQTMWAAGLDHDHELKDWCSQQGITLEGHLTYQNKWDNAIGVSQFVNNYLAEPCEISLPYLDARSQEATDAYRHQLLYFSLQTTNKNVRKGYKSDLVMASWFPMDAIRRARSEQIAEMGVDFEPMYSSFTESTWDTPPWSRQEDELIYD